MSFSKCFWVVAIENTPRNKKIIKVGDKRHTRTASVNTIQVSSSLAWNMFLKPVKESLFSSEGVCDEDCNGACF